MRLAFLHAGQGVGAPSFDQSLKTMLTGHLQQDGAETGVIFYDQHHAISGLNVVAIVTDLNLGRCGVVG
jgi:hypothetical protein